MEFLVESEIEINVEVSSFDEAWRTATEPYIKALNANLASIGLLEVNFEKEDLGPYIDYVVCECEHFSRRAVRKNAIETGHCPFSPKKKFREHKGCSLKILDKYKVCAACKKIIQSGFYLTGNNHGATYCSKECMLHQLSGKIGDEKYLSFGYAIPNEIIRRFSYEANEVEDKSEIQDSHESEGL